MAKREFLQLCHRYDPIKHRVNGWMLSSKLDGQRAFYDGGVSRGVPCRDVPWANTQKDDRLIYQPIATGLWSRMGKAIMAPSNWLDKLPSIPLDGELWIGPERFQELMSITKRLDGEGDWSDVKYMVFDSPPIPVIFADGVIEVRYGAEKYSRRFDYEIISKWIRSRGIGINEDVRQFERVINFLQTLPQNDVFQVHTQSRIPFGTDKAHEFVEAMLDIVLKHKGEGIVLRNNWTNWSPTRSHNCLKYKPQQDAEGTVIGYIAGREGKLQGLMGAMIVDFNGKRLELSGFTDEERILSEDVSKIPGQNVPEGIVNPRFPIGSIITFRYRELSDDGIPKEARYLRIHQ